MRIRNQIYDICGQKLTINDIVAITGIDYKIIHKRIKKGYPLDILLDEEKCIEHSKKNYRNKRDKNFIECIGEKSGLLEAIEFINGDVKQIKAQCECGEVVYFKNPSIFRIAKSCKSIICITKTSLMTKDKNGTRCRPKITITEKVCSKCKIKKSSDSFRKLQKRLDGFSSCCKKCMSSYPASSIEYYRKYRNNNRSRLNAQMAISKKRRYASDPRYRIRDALAQRVRSAVKFGYKSASTMELVGCDIEFLKGYLEAKFELNMSWENYGEWHIDHIKPCSSFDLNEEEQQRKCFHYSNLQPLWATTEIARKNGSNSIGNVEKSNL